MKNSYVADLNIALIIILDYLIDYFVHSDFFCKIKRINMNNF